MLERSWGSVRCTRIHAVEVVEVWCETQALDGALDVGLDVLGGVGHRAIFEGGEAALGGNCVVI